MLRLQERQLSYIGAGLIGLQQPQRVLHLAARSARHCLPATRLAGLSNTCRRNAQLRAIGRRPDSHPRAVASACARNPVGLLVPRHRVISANGSLSGYRWGLPRKAALLRAEASKTAVLADQAESMGTLP